MPAKTFIHDVRRCILDLVHPQETDRESGQSMIVVALALVGLVSFAALIFDGGNAYAQRRRMQNAADAAVLAGARAITAGAEDCTIYDIINRYAVTKNGAQTFDAKYIHNNGDEVNVPNGCATRPDGSVIGLRVYAFTNYNTFFAAIFGAATASVSATAAAGFGSVDVPNSLQPLARKCTQPRLELCFTEGQEYDIWQESNPGNFGWLAFHQGQDAVDLARELDPNYDLNGAYGYRDPTGTCTTLRAGCYVLGSTGISNASDIRSELDDWMSAGAIGKTMTIAIYDQVLDPGSNAKYHIIGFASFIITDYKLPGQSANHYVTGRFVRSYDTAPICQVNCMPTTLVSIMLRP